MRGVSAAVGVTAGATTGATGSGRGGASTGASTGAMRAPAAGTGRALAVVIPEFRPNKWAIASVVAAGAGRLGGSGDRVVAEVALGGVPVNVPSGLSGVFWASSVSSRGFDVSLASLVSVMRELDSSSSALSGVGTVGVGDCRNILPAGGGLASSRRGAC